MPDGRPIDCWRVTFVDKGSDVIILVNGRHIEHLDGVATKLTEDDYVAITPLVAGG